MRVSTRLLPRAGLLALALTCAIPAPTTASAATDGRFCALNLSILGTGVELLCSGPKGSAATDTSCQAFEPIRWSRQDTPDTIAQAKAHNAAWLALCGPLGRRASKP